MLQLSVIQDVQHIIPISGKDSLACALLQTAKEPSRDYKFLFNDTGSELPETYEWLNKVEKKTGWEIIKTNVTIEAKIHSWNGFLPSHQNRWCTSTCKIKPMDELVSSAPAWVYYGLRADEPERKGFIPTRKNNIFPVYPLREAGLSLHHVWAILEAQNLLPPAFHWQRLENAVIAILPPSEWIPLTAWQRRMLFAGRTRSNCFHCFYQRLYEWLWLKETHPELFYKAKSWEKDKYTWNANHPLKDFEQQDFCIQIFNKRVSQIVKILKGEAKESDSDIAGVSCGLICGK